MNKLFLAAAAIGSMLVASAPADAQYWRRGHTSVSIGIGVPVGPYYGSYYNYDPYAYGYAYDPYYSYGYYPAYSYGRYYDRDYYYDRRHYRRHHHDRYRRGDYYRW